MGSFLPAFKGFGMLVRGVAVVSSSIVTIISTMLPLFIYDEVSTGYLVSLLFLLMAGAFIVHGILTHVFNDIADFHSGTDEHSPALLSGGSRVLQDGVMSMDRMKLIGMIFTSILLLLAIISTVLHLYEFTILIAVGLWGAATYSLSPFRFAYYPFIGEWLSLFPAILLLGIAAPWIAIDAVPVWAWQNSLVNALWCMAWVMVHHVPDMQADKRATPLKRTTVVFAADLFGKSAARLPALLYMLIVGGILVWMFMERPLAAIGAGIALLIGIFLVMTMDVENMEQVTLYEKILLLLAMFTAVWLGCFI